MSTFEKAWARTGAIEGGYSNNPDDPGGETNHGVTLRVARAAGYFGEMRELPVAQARAIAEQEYWTRPGFDMIAAVSEPVALELFDTNYNLWFPFAGQCLQRALNVLNQKAKDWPDVAVDGKIGARTVFALEKYIDRRGREGEAVLLAILNGVQCAEYLRQAEGNPAKETFFYGWVRARCMPAIMDER